MKFSLVAVFAALHTDVVSASLSDFRFIARHYYPAGYIVDHGNHTTPDL
jgi:hypothetical protein